MWDTTKNDFRLTSSTYTNNVDVDILEKHKQFTNDENWSDNNWNSGKSTYFDETNYWTQATFKNISDLELKVTYK